MKLVLIMFLIYLIFTLGLIAFGVAIGFLLHWILPRVDLGTSILIAVVATGYSIHYFIGLIKLSEYFDPPLFEEDDKLPPIWDYTPSTQPARKRKRKSN